MNVTQILNQKKIIINLSSEIKSNRLECSYDVVAEVAKQQMGWKVSRNENFGAEWDVFWADLGVDSEMLSVMRPY